MRAESAPLMKEKKNRQLRKKKNWDKEKIIIRKGKKELIFLIFFSHFFLSITSALCISWSFEYRESKNYIVYKKARGCTDCATKSACICQSVRLEGENSEKRENIILFEAYFLSLSLSLSSSITKNISSF